MMPHGKKFVSPICNILCIISFHRVQMVLISHGSLHPWHQERSQSTLCIWPSRAVRPPKQSPRPRLSWPSCGFTVDQTPRAWSSLPACQTLTLTTPPNPLSSSASLLATRRATAPPHKCDGCKVNLTFSVEKFLFWAVTRGILQLLFCFAESNKDGLSAKPAPKRAVSSPDTWVAKSPVSQKCILFEEHLSI